MPIDLSNLSDDVLSYSNDRLHTFIEESLGTDEMMLIKIQSINNVRALLNVPDLMAFLSFNSKEVVALKQRICFIDEDNKRFMIKAGIKTNIDDLVLALKEKKKKETKQKRTYKSSSTSLQSSTQLNGDQSNASQLNASNLTSINSQLTQVFSTTPKINSPNYYIQKVSDSIEKFCVNTFKNIILLNDIDYVISVNILDANINGYIKCKCNTNIKLIFRSKSNVFQLSAYFKHIKSSCIMIKKKKKELNNISSNNNNLSNLVVQDNTSNINNSQDISDELILNEEDESFQTVNNDSITTASNSYETTKRSLSSRSTSNTTKKIRSSL